MPSTPLVSVVVLNFNGEQILRRCLDHLLAQTYPHFEIIVVDNNSSDGSRAILEDYLGSGKLSVVCSRRNLGVPGGRNLGALYARGDIVAFMDNDGYARSTWLEAVVRALDADAQIGAVASLVFFNKHKLVLNGAGATINQRGYGGDFCFNTPYEFAQLPETVLYPMGCGMVVRRSVLEAIGALDALAFNYFDDVELGIRTWSAGYRVVVAPDAWVDHDFGSADAINRNKVLLCERNRIRTVLKYFPLARVPRWLLHEAKIVRYLAVDGLRSVPFRAWAWNVMHLPSALRWRWRFGGAARRFWHLVDPSWGVFPPALPNNHTMRPDAQGTSHQLTCSDGADRTALNYGWYYHEREYSLPYRWTTAAASALFRFTAPVSTCLVTARVAHPDQRVTLVLRRFGELAPERIIPLAPSPVTWETQRHRCHVGAGTYELLVLTTPVHHDATGRALGVAVAAVRFT